MCLVPTRAIIERFKMLGVLLTQCLVPWNTD
eukprot:UN09174